MVNLSTFITGYLEANLFNGGKFQDGESFHAALERVLHEAIFTYRKKVCEANMIEEGEGTIAADKKELVITAALLMVEENNPYNQQKPDS